jgi:hypothetical protein
VSNADADADADANNVTVFPGTTRLDLPPDRVLAAAVGQLETVLVIGYTSDGDEYFASSTANGADVVWLLERTKLRLLRTVD